MAADTFRYVSPLGKMSYRWDGARCLAVHLLQEAAEQPVGEDPVRAWLDAYFSGKTAPLPPLADASSPFQSRLRQALLEIPAGSTRTYGELAGELHTGPRALGQGVGANPIPLIVPCHRVVASNGGLGGFSCGLEWKRRLLDFESRVGR